MKKIILLITLFTLTARIASAQLLPSFQLGIKGGVNLSTLSSSGTFNSANRAGYLGGLWARVGALGFTFQPELYLTSKDVNITNSDGGITKAKFTSVDVPLLFTGKFGAFGLGGRFYTGPLASLAVNKDQSFGGAVDKAVTLNYHDQNFAWVFGGGVDIRNLSFDLRYEAGLTKQVYNDSHTRINIFSLSVAVPLIKI